MIDATVTVMPITAFFVAAMLSPTSREDFSQSYGVRVSANRGRCTYWLTDAGMNTSRQLTATLQANGYDVRRGAEILTDRDVSARCVRKAMQAVRRAGFTRVRARPGTDRDRLPGIP